MTNLEIAKQYYQYFNNANWEAMLSLLAENIVHEPNQGKTRIGKKLFTAFLAQMEISYQERLEDLYFMTNEQENRIAVEFTVHGKYLKAEQGLPPAQGQTYQLPAAAFLVIEDGKIQRISTYYNLPLWIELVS